MHVNKIYLGVREEEKLGVRFILCYSEKRRMEMAEKVFSMMSNQVVMFEK